MKKQPMSELLGFFFSKIINKDTTPQIFKNISRALFH